MKNSEFKVLTVGLGVALFTLQGCEKPDCGKLDCEEYEDGSLITKKGRLVGEWERVDPPDFFGEVVAYVWEFENDFDFEWKLTVMEYGVPSTYSGMGEWQWGDGRESVILDFDGDYTMLKILKLTSEELVLEYDGEEWEFEKQ